MRGRFSLPVEQGLTGLEPRANVRRAPAREMNDLSRIDGYARRRIDAQPSRRTIELLGELGQIDRPLPTGRGEPANLAVRPLHQQVEPEHLRSLRVVEQELTRRETELAGERVFHRARA